MPPTRTQKHIFIPYDCQNISKGELVLLYTLNHVKYFNVSFCNWAYGFLLVIKVNCDLCPMLKICLLEFMPGTCTEYSNNELDFLHLIILVIMWTLDDPVITCLFIFCAGLGWEIMIISCWCAVSKIVMSKIKHIVIVELI